MIEMRYQQISRGKLVPVWGTIVVLMLILVAGCQKESDNSDNQVKDSYLVNYTSIRHYPLETIHTFLSALVGEYPEANSILEHTQYGVQVYSINYQTHYQDSLITASGLVCLPMADEVFPVISFQNGTNTAHENAPTKNPVDEYYILLEIMASNGYIVLLPDYIGFGASESILHPYYHRTSTNNAVIDMMHALNEMIQKNDILPERSDSTYLMGYSQGGWATLSVLDEIENGGETGIDVVAASCGAGAYDLMMMSTYIFGLESYPSPLYLPYFIYSQQNIGALQDPLDKYFKSPYAERIPQLFDGSYSNDEVNSQLTDQIADLLTGALIDNFQTGQEFSKLRELLIENSISAWDTNIKLHLYHGTADQNVPNEQSAKLYDDFISAGANPELVNYFELNGMDHGSGLLPWGISSINWFNTLENK